MNAFDFVQSILPETTGRASGEGRAFAPANIALCKYWGKRDWALNLPVTPSLSIGLGEKGATTTVSICEGPHDQFILNNGALPFSAPAFQRLRAFLDLFRTKKNFHFHVKSFSNIPIAAGLASSAAGFASIVLALDDLFQWALEGPQLSVLARLGSGSACRSIWPGFVEWQAGTETNGSDSHGVPLVCGWPDLRIGLLLVFSQAKKTSSRMAMQKTLETSVFYPQWPKKVAHDLPILKQAIETQDFSRLGQVSESNALAMHALMLSASPPICYALPETVGWMHRIWEWRGQGLGLYFTQDAGPNLKLLFLKQDLPEVLALVPGMEVIVPFN